MAKRPTEKSLGIQQIPFRIHRNDFLLMKKLLENDGLKFQHFVTAAIESFLRGDASIMKVIKDWRELNLIPKDQKQNYTLSHRERDDLLDAFEKGFDKEKKG